MGVHDIRPGSIIGPNCGPSDLSCRSGISLHIKHVPSGPSAKAAAMDILDGVGVIIPTDKGLECDFSTAGHRKMKLIRWSEC